MHTTWYAAAPLLAASGITVVCPDLRGYGQSSTLEPDPEHHVYCDRAMADDIVRLLQQLGHECFSIVGHDRGSYLAYRTALDHCQHVEKLAVLDCVPIVEALKRVDAHFAELWGHWFFFATEQSERVITADPMAWYQPDSQRMGRENYDDLADAINTPAIVRAMLEDYRAGLRVDRAHDEADRTARRRITCPTLVAWSCHDDMEDLYGYPGVIWESWCEQPPRTAVIKSGRHMAEENPRNSRQY